MPMINPENLYTEPSTGLSIETMILIPIFISCPLNSKFPLWATRGVWATMKTLTR